MKVLDNLYYTEKDDYLKVDGDVAFFGVTDYAQEQLGEITYVDFESLEVGKHYDKDEEVCTIEAAKTAETIIMPVSGEIVEINEEIEDDPEVVNEDCYGKGWIFKIKLSDKSELDGLMNAEAYKKMLEDRENN